LSKGRKGESKRERERERELGSQFTAIYEIFIVPIIHAESLYFYRRRVFTAIKKRVEYQRIMSQKYLPYG